MAELKIDKEWVKDAVQPVIDDVKANYIHKSVIENIKAEIEAARYGAINDGLDVALVIIDKHINGDMRGAE